MGQPAEPQPKEHTPAHCLRAGRALIAKPGGWGQKKFARDAKGNIVNWYCRDAVCFCSIGALWHACPTDNLHRQKASAFLCKAAKTLQPDLPPEAVGVVQFNDQPGRKQEDVVKLYDLALELAGAA